MPVPDFSAYKVVAGELSSATKFSNWVQAVQDEFGDIDPDQIPGYPADATKFLRGDGAWAAPSGVGIPAGVITAFGGAAAPTGWLMCDGAAVSRTTYADLFAALSTSYGVGDGSTTFNLPDLRGRIPVGKGSNVAVDTLGENDGVAEANRRPQHRHTAHTHATATFNEGATNTSAGFQRGDSGAGSQAALATDSKDGGSGNANDALDAPAFQVVNYIVKT